MVAIFFISPQCVNIGDLGEEWWHTHMYHGVDEFFLNKKYTNEYWENKVNEMKSKPNIVNSNVMWASWVLSGFSVINFSLW